MVNVTGDRSIEGVRAGFLQFADTVFADNTPLCRHLALSVAEDPDLLGLAARAQIGQYPAYLLFAAVQYLLMGDPSEALAAFFPTLSPEPAAAEAAFPAFREFCARRSVELSDLVSTRLVQTNEVGRCASLTPAFAYVDGLAGGAPLHLIDIGAAAGLNMLFDRYQLDYGRLRWGEPSSPVRIRCELGDATDPPLAGWQPSVCHRVGVDINPIDLKSEDQSRWLQALVWPDRPERAAVLARAMTVAVSDQQRVLAGDAVALLPDLLAEAGEGEVVCVYQSYALEYFPHESRDKFARLLDDFGTKRDLYFVEMSGIGDNGGVRLTSWRSGERSQLRLGQCPPHGQWLKWLV